MTTQDDVTTVADLVAGRTFNEACAALTDAELSYTARGDRIIDVNNGVRVQLIGSRIGPTARPYWTVYAVNDLLAPAKRPAM